MGRASERLGLARTDGTEPPSRVPKGTPHKRSPILRAATTLSICGRAEGVWYPVERHFRSSDWFIVSGGLFVLVGSLLPWWTLSFGGALDVSQNGYDFGLTGRLPIVLLLAVAILTVVVKTDSLPLPDWLIHPYAMGMAVLVAAVGIGVRFFWSGYDSTDNVSRGLGLYLVAAGVVCEVVGSVLAIRDLRRPAVDVDDGADDADDDLDVDAELDDYEEDALDDYEEDDLGDYEEDDLVRRFNSSLPTGETPVQLPPNPEPTPRAPTPRQPSTRRRPRGTRQPRRHRRSRRRPTGPPLP